MAEEKDVEFMSPHQDIKTISINGTILTQSTYWTLEEDSEHLKGQEKSPRSGVGKMKGKKKRIIKGTSNPGGKLKARRGSCNQKIPSWWGNLRGQKGTFGGSKNTVDHLWKAGQSKNCAHGLYCSLASPAWVTCLLSRGGLGAGKWGLDMDPGRGQLVAVKRAWMDSSKEFNDWESLQKKARTPQKQGATAEWWATGRAVILIPIPTHPLQPVQALGGALIWGGSPSTHTSSQGLLCQDRLQHPEHRPSQSLLQNQPWVPLTKRGFCQCWWGLRELNTKMWG